LPQVTTSSKPLPEYPSAPQPTKESMVNIMESVYRPHWVNQTTRALSDQHICRYPTRVPSAA